MPKWKLIRSHERCWLLNDNFSGRRPDEYKADQVAGCFADKFAGFFTDKLAGRRADKPGHILVSLPPDLPTHTSYVWVVLKMIQ